MKRKLKQLRKEYKMPHLFLDDLEKIENILIEGKVKKYEISTPEFEYEKISEIQRDLEESVFDFNLKSYDPCIILDLSHSNAVLYTTDDDINSRGIFSKIDQVIIKSERKFLWFLVKAIENLGGVFIFLILYYFGYFFTERRYLPFFIIIFMVIPIIIYFIVMQDNYKFSFVEFVRKKERVGFINRNKDQIILVSLAAIIGSFITFLLNYFFKFY